jgi:endonuclease G
MLAGCGPQLAVIEGDDLPPPAQVGQPVLPAMPMRGPYEPMRVAPVGSPMWLAEPMLVQLAEAVDAGEAPDAGESVDAGVSEPVDAGTSQASDAGNSLAVDAGSAQQNDAGSAQQIDAGTSQQNDAGSAPLCDAGTSQQNDAGSAQQIDAGSAQPSDAGSAQLIDGGSAQQIDAGTSQQNDAGIAPPSDAGSPQQSDAGTGSAPQNDAGSAPSSDAGSTQPSDAGTTDPTDAGAAWDGGTNGLAISVHLSLGVPDDSSVGVSTRWLLLRTQLATSYDTTRKVPRWSSWTLDATHFGTATRATSFRTDPQLPTGVPQARDSDYVNSGFDRGHLCPSADRTATDADNDATFFLTNVVPQTHTSNAGPWLDLEDEARAIARTGKKLVIIAGPIFGATQQSIGTGVQVPVSMFKVAVIIDGEYGPSSVTSSTKVYAAIVPNASVLSGAWRSYQVTIDEVERQTGLDFLSDVHPTLQAELETHLDP